jgi:hypothetical protein
LIIYTIEGKWNITHEEWPWNLYPRYFNGQAVAISGSSILPLLAAFQTTPMMPFDDVYYIGICTERNGVTLQFASASTIGDAFIITLLAYIDFIGTFRQ